LSAGAHLEAGGLRPADLRVHWVSGGVPDPGCGPGTGPRLICDFGLYSITGDQRGADHMWGIWSTESVVDIQSESPGTSRDDWPSSTGLALFIP